MPKISNQAGLAVRHAGRSPIGALLGVFLFGIVACDKKPAAKDGLPPGHYPPNTTQEPQPGFVQFIDLDNNEGRLETAIATYEGENGEKVELISAVHIADAAYYARLGERFASYDSLLYELVKPEGEAPPEPGRDRSVARGLNPIALLQRAMGSGLELAYQIEAIDYSAKNFVHADLSAETFLAMSEERGQTVTKLLLQAMLQEFANMLKGDSKLQSDPLLEVKMLTALFSKQRAKRLKYLFAQQLQNAEAMAADFATDLDGEDSVLIVERNKKAIEVLRERLIAGEKHIGVFYGGAHLADLEQRIFKEIGLRRTGVRWETAWLIE